MDLRESLKSLIAESEMKQKAVAERAGFTEQMMSDMLQGRKVIKAEFVPAICQALGVTPEEIGVATGTLGIPEFGTSFVRGMLTETLPSTMEELVRISGLSHGTGVWLDNAQEIIRKGIAPLRGCVCTRDDIMKLFDIKMGRILKFNSDKANAYIESLKDRIAEINRKLSQMVEVTIDWYRHLKEKYGAGHPRLTVIRNFDNIEAAKVAEANEKLYINREDGFIGTALKKDEFICNCSDIDDIIIFYKDGKYKVVKVADKLYVGKNILYINVFKRNDRRTIYNLVYQNGKGGVVYMKRFAVTGITRDKEYDMTQGEKGTKIWWFSANPNGEAETLRVTLKEKPRLKVLQFDINFADLAIKGRQALGNIVTKNEVHRIAL